MVAFDKVFGKFEKNYYGFLPTNHINENCNYIVKLTTKPVLLFSI
jgi:hypothetical protein